MPYQQCGKIAKKYLCNGLELVAGCVPSEDDGLFHGTVSCSSFTYGIHSISYEKLIEDFTNIAFDSIQETTGAAVWYKMHNSNQLPNSYIRDQIIGFGKFLSANNIGSIRATDVIYFYNEKSNFIMSYIKITYEGGAVSYEQATGNSVTADIQVIAARLNGGGYYCSIDDETVGCYELLFQRSYCS